MLNLRTLMSKTSFTKLNGDTIVNLAMSTVSFLGIRANSGKAYVVTEETAMRPDLIASYFYQDPGYLDLLLKYNGYPNPFALDVGDIIRIPSMATLSKFGSTGKVNDPKLMAVRKKYTNLVMAPRSRKDQVRMNYLLQKGTAINSNLAKLNALLQSGNLSSLSLSALSSQISNIMQGGNFSGTGPLTSAYQAGASAPVPPNIALDSGVKIQNGKILFGSDVTSVKKEDCTEPISRTKLKETLLKNRLA
jgi:hypothetical protein